MLIAYNAVVKEGISIASYFFFFKPLGSSCQRSLLRMFPFLVGLKYLARLSLTILLTMRTNDDD